MSAIAIRDLEVSNTLDRQALSTLFGAGAASGFSVYSDTGWYKNGQSKYVEAVYKVLGVTIGKKYHVTQYWKRVMKGKNSYHVTKWF